MTTGPKAEALAHLQRQAQNQGVPLDKCELKVGAAEERGLFSVRPIQLVCGGETIAETTVVCVITDRW